LLSLRRLAFDESERVTKTAPLLTFDAERHEYRLDGRLVPSVTQVVRAILPGWNASAWHMHRGSATHHGCRLLDEGRLDWQSVDDEIRPRLAAWQKFRSEWPAEVTFCEKPVASLVYQFAGTLDRMFRCGAERVLCDLKNTIEPGVRVQLGGYSLAWHEMYPARRIDRAVAVELRDCGDYRCLWLDRHELRRAEQTFLGCLTVFNFMVTHGIRGRE
jgi:hypothetical protein